MPANPPFNVAIRQLYAPGLAPDGVTRVESAISDFGNVFNTDHFKDRILQFGGSSFGFSFNYGLDNNGVYQKLMAAIELQGNMAPHTADLYIRIIPGPSPDGRTIGYVTNYSKVINTYGAFVYSLPHAALAAHFAHEWTHVLGFRHPVNVGTNYDVVRTTVPYAVEEIVDDILVRREQGEVIT